jgi:hypothetical protein
MVQLNTYDIIVQSALKGIELQRSDGSFPKGHNGPWYEEDTYVRTTAHWAITLFKGYEITEKQHLLDSAIRACDYLLSKEARPHRKTFYCLASKHKNRCNGLIGQAWAVEPLLILGKALDNQGYLSVAEEVLNLHPYCFKRHGWSSVEIDGQVLGLNPTFNQQVWLSAMALLAGQRNQDLLTKARDFFENMPSVTKFIEKGLIRHRKGRYKSVKQLVKDAIKLKYSRHVDGAEIKKRSLGYMSFILYGLAIVYDNFPGESFWKNTSFKSVIKHSISYVVFRYPFGYLGSNEYQWDCTPTGIEIAYALQVFSNYLELGDEGDALKWVTMQFSGYYDLDTNLMRRNTSDEDILGSRIYEATRLRNYKISIHE